jgi:transcriptional regulator with GAF, ATPase, and Fis domain
LRGCVKDNVILPLHLLLLLFVKVARRSSTLVQELQSDYINENRTADELAGKRQAVLAALKAHDSNVQPAARSLGSPSRYVQAQLDKYIERVYVSALPRLGRRQLLNTAQIEAAAAVDSSSCQQHRQQL